MIHSLRYSLVQALRGIRSGWTIQLASTGSIAVGLLLVGLAVLGGLNLERMTRALGEGIQIVVYLRPDAPAAQVKRLRGTLEGHAIVAAVRHVSSQDAFRRLSDGLRPGVLAGVEPSFLPASLEVSLKETSAEQMRPLLALLSASPLVEEVDNMGHWVSRLAALVNVARGGALGLALIVCLACLYIVGTTIRLGVFARRDEIEILQLVGATDRFVRAPFLLEGALQGLLGAVLAAGVLYAIYVFAAPHLEDLSVVTLSQITLAFLSPAQLGLGLAGGLVLGLAGSRVALGRYMDL